MIKSQTQHKTHNPSGVLQKPTVNGRRMIKSPLSMGIGKPNSLLHNNYQRNRRADYDMQTQLESFFRTEQNGIDWNGLEQKRTG